MKHLGAAAAIAAAGLALFAATGLGGQGGSPGAQLTIAGEADMETVRSERLSDAEAAARGFAVASKRNKIKVTLEAEYLVGTADVSVNPGSGTLVPLDCPKKSVAVSGGMQNNRVALVENSSSRTTTAANAPAADWYEGVSNTNDGGAALGFRPTLVCVKLK